MSNFGNVTLKDTDGNNFAYINSEGELFVKMDMEIFSKILVETKKVRMLLEEAFDNEIDEDLEED